MVFHLGYERVDRLNAVVAHVVVSAIERVCLVDKKHRSVCIAAHTRCFGRGFSDVLTAEISAFVFVQIAYAQHAFFFENLAEYSRNGGFARAGIADKAHVQARAVRSVFRLG